ncbi:hypothetical protein ABZX51_010620 [Aspergillus tubingensis]
MVQPKAKGRIQISTRSFRGPIHSPNIFACLPPLAVKHEINTIDSLDYLAMVRIVGLLMVITPYDDMILGEKIRFEPNRTEPTIFLPFSSISPLSDDCRSSLH